MTTTDPTTDPTAIFRSLRPEPPSWLSIASVPADLLAEVEQVYTDLHTALRTTEGVLPALQSAQRTSKAVSRVISEVDLPDDTALTFEAAIGWTAVDELVLTVDAIVADILGEKPCRACDLNEVRKRHGLG